MSYQAKSLVEAIAGALRTAICQGYQPGDKLAGMHELRQHFGTSINTIGAALDILASEGLVDKRRGSGVYISARAERRRIGILSELDLLDARIGPHFRTVANLLRQRLSDRGAEVQLYIGHAEPGLGVSDEPTCPQFWDDMAAGHLDGAVILDVPSTPAWQQRISQLARPAVGAMTGYETGGDVPGMTAAAVHHLAGLGCRRLGLLAWQGDDDFRRAVAAAGLTTCDAWIRVELDPATGGAGWAEFREIWASTAGQPDGLVILDDMLFADAQLAMLDLQVRIPQDVQLVVLSVRGASRPPRVPAARLEVNPDDEAQFLVDCLWPQLHGEAVPPSRHRGAFHLCPAPHDAALDGAGSLNPVSTEAHAIRRPVDPSCSGSP
jgi:DNA-binding LacI/PurR family transcriptional regulator